jgi:large conductance mechanosensitive channel
VQLTTATLEFGLKREFSVMVRARQATGFIADFQKFIMQGNVVDLAVAVVIGAAFGKIVTSFVDNIIMPIVTMLIPGGSWREAGLPLGTKLAKDAAGNDVTVVNKLLYGPLLGTIVDFLIIAFVIFLIVRALEKFKRKKEAAEEAAPPSNEERLVSVLERLEAKI